MNLDLGGSDQDGRLADLVEMLGTLIAAYGEETIDVPAASGVQVLRFLMGQHGLRQSDLPELGAQGVVFELLSYLRALSARQLRAMRDRFGVAADVFL